MSQCNFCTLADLRVSAKEKDMKLTRLPAVNAGVDV